MVGPGDAARTTGGASAGGASAERGRKNFVGPRLRQLRREHKQTQAEMARALGLSAAYVNLLENNQRSLSVQVLMRLSEVYGVDWREMIAEDGPTRLADLRALVQDPIFAGRRPDIEELRAALDHAPALVDCLTTLHKAHRALTERLLSATGGGEAVARGVVGPAPEAAVHDLFRGYRNHFPTLEAAAEAFRADADIEPDNAYNSFKRRLDHRHAISVEVVPVAALPNALRYYDRTEGRVFLSQGLDYQNRVFQLAHLLGLIEHEATIDALIEGARVGAERARGRLRVELANYWAAAVLMPYEAFLREAEAHAYDIDHLAAAFGVSFEQVCHRLTTLGREGRSGVPFFFMRIDKAGNVTKRFNATSFHLAQYGGACPRLDVHLCFRQPGRILPQFVEMPDGSRYFTINRTVDRPVLSRQTQDNRLAVCLGTAMEFAREITYAHAFRLGEAGLATPIGINCRLCPRSGCAQRAHQPVHLDLAFDPHRRGETRFES
ncbi:MAG: short-chain fatty acyl-CoA regulator family protein [Paracoccaceae bacterium]